MSELAILVPVLRRPHRVAPTLESIGRTTGNATVVFIPDPDDEGEINALEENGAEWFGCEGNYARKINEGVRRTEEDFLLFAADDLEYHRGWYRTAKAKLSKKIGVVATNDLCNPRNQRGELATHPLVARWYAEAETIDRSPGPLSEAYPHEYVDREFSEVARSRGAFAYAEDSVVEHLHPMCGKAPDDDIYRKMRERMVYARPIYVRRRKMWLRAMAFEEKRGP